MKTSELTGAALDWAVAKIEGYTMNPTHKKSAWISYSTDWSQGGPIIERENISLLMCGWDTVDAAMPVWQATSYSGREVIDGPSPLIAAMRCYVASQLGDEVDVPEELK
jgi:hypothetical protein